MWSNPNRPRSAEPGPEHGERDCRRDHGIGVHEDNDDDEGKPARFTFIQRFDYRSNPFTLEDVRMSMVNFSRIVRLAESCARRRSSFKS